MLAQLRPGCFQGGHQPLFFPAACHQGLPQFQQATAQGFRFIAVLGGAKTEAAAALRQTAAGHGAAFLQQFSFQRHGAIPPQLLSCCGEV